MYLYVKQHEKFIVLTYIIKIPLLKDCISFRREQPILYDCEENLSNILVQPIVDCYMFTYWIE